MARRMLRSRLPVIFIVWAMTIAAQAWVSTSPAAAADEPPARETPVSEPSRREIVERSGPAVVLIEVTTASGTQQGSGFLIKPTGSVMTNLHVVDGARAIKVSLPDGRRFEEVTARTFDVSRDVVVLHLEMARDEKPLPSMELGVASSLRPGDSILVISNPLRLESTVTDGIVSAWRPPRTDEADAERSSAQTTRPLPDCRILQISAPISPGSSGGPVFDRGGRVIGIATAGVLYGAAGLNFAVPVDELKLDLDTKEVMDLVTFGRRVDEARLDLARPHYERAEMLSNRPDGRPEAARELDRALGIFPRYGKALQLSGEILEAEGKLAKARERFEAAVEASPEDPEAWYRLGHLYGLLAATERDDDLLDRAEAALRKTLALDPREARAELDLAVIRLRQGRPEEAERLLRGLVQNDRNLVEAQRLLGEIYLSDGRNEEAQKAFEQVLWIDADNALAHFGLARLMMQSPEKRGAAYQHWKEFLRLSSGDDAYAKQREFAEAVLERYFPDKDR